MTSKERTIEKIKNQELHNQRELKKSGKVSIFSQKELHYYKEVLKTLEQKEYTDRKNADLLETINCIKNHAMIKKTKGLGSEVIVSFHSSDDDFEKVGWVFGIIK